ncbi:2-succinyl-6-hydroxy-2,4-cyclohexadiene-1-carboxylate synthase [Ferrimonas pelagia]|uniref:Putative 2-succinyl-6-hydroxy-2,4-cyclohexadiene-1-carboxylate synthase n=1 Tax=Ferrimonas pelagia TaxID=1177826 RepID=A0ABP9EVM6_9GAMM
MADPTAPLALRRWGDPTLPPLVLLHGFLGSSADWQPVADALGQRFHCIAVDLPGHGDSAQVQLTTPPAFEHCVDLLLASLRALPRFHLLGYSLGGRLALHLAQHLQSSQPQRLLSLTLESAHPGLTDPAQRQQRLEADACWHQSMLDQPMQTFLDAWYRQGVFADLSDARRAQMIAARSGNDPRALSALYLGTSLGHQSDLRGLANAMPIRLLTGEHDTKFSEMGQHWAARTALSHRVIRAGGHNLHAGAPEAFVAAFCAQ